MKKSFKYNFLIIENILKKKNFNSKRAAFKKYYLSLNNKKKAIFKYMLDKTRKQKHRLHVVSPSPWPFHSAISAFLFVIGMVLWMHQYTSIPLICGIIGLFSSFVFWFRDIIREGVYMGYHTKIVNKCLRYGFILFLISEVMFFFGFFWALLHYSLTPSIFAGGIWPPQGIVIYLLSENVNDLNSYAGDYLKARTPILISENHEVDLPFYDYSDFNNLIEEQDLFRIKYKKPKDFDLFNRNASDTISFFFQKQIYDKPDLLFWNTSKVYINFYSHGVFINPYKIPLLNTAILLTSGFILTIAHSYLRHEAYKASYRMLLTTIYFGLAFIILQAKEYFNSGFSINDGVYGSIFYMLTGFHGFHVIIGTIFLIVCAFRMRYSHFTANNHFAFEASAWYWHFVDVVWIVLYLLLYLWPNAKYFSEYATAHYNPYESLFLINITAEFYFKFINKDPNFSIATDINLEYEPHRKAFIVHNILGHFIEEIYQIEEEASSDLKRIRAEKWLRLLEKIKAWKTSN